MKKPILIAAATAVLAAFQMNAAPAFPGKQTVTQPDGTTIEVRVVGDERFHTLVTDADALPIARDADGEYRYRMADGSLSAVAAHNLGERTAAEADFLRANIAEISVARLVERQRAINPKRFENAIAARKAKAPARAGAANAPLADQFTDCPTTGVRRIPVIFVQYTDIKFKSSDPKQTFATYFNEGASSGRQYFIDNSNGVYQPQFDLYGPVTLPNNRKYYGGNVGGNDQRPGQMVADACTALDGQINFKDYDTNGDGYVDAVILLYAGNGEQYTYQNIPDAIWPHKWELSSSDYGKTLTLDGVKIDNYGCFNELYGTSASSTKIDGIGVFCHEFSHALGLPDLYYTGYDDVDYYGMGSWSLMCQGCYNNDGYTPVGYTAYDKWFNGWIDEIPEATANTQYTMPVFNTGVAANDQPLRITNPSNANEWFVITNRANTGWNRYDQDEGLLIYRVTYNRTVWANNTVNNTSTGYYVPLCADNSASYYNEDTDLWPYNNKTELSGTTTPALKPYSGAALNRSISEMTRNADGTVSFWVDRAPVPTLATPVLAGHTSVGSTSFTANWTHQTDADVTYTLEVIPHRDFALLYDVDFSQGLPQGWSVSGFHEIDQNENALRLASSNNPGEVYTPQFTLDNSGIVTVKVNAKYYRTEASSLKVTLYDTNDNELTSMLQALTESYKDYTIKITGTPGAKVSLGLGATAKKKRLYIKSAQIYTGDASATAAPAKAPAETGDANSRTITGITGLSYTVEGLAEKGSFDYRVKAVPVDQTTAAASAWTAYNTVELSLSGVENVGTEADTDAPARYFNLQGIEVNASTLAPGIYIRLQGGRSEKIAVR